MSQQLIKQLKNIKVEVDAEWKQATRDFLLSEIKAEKPAQRVVFEQPVLWERLKLVKFAWRPVGVFALAGIFFVSLFGLTTSAAQQAMPGDKMFAVKKMIEKTQDIFTADNARKVELASVFLDNRVNELQKAIMEETQLVSADKKSTKVSLAVAEVNKQLNEVNNKIEKLKEDNKGNSGVVALMLNEKIQNYKQELKEVKSKVKDDKVDSQIDQALAQVGEVDNHILEVIVDKQKAGQLEIKQEELQDKLNQHVQEIESKVAEVEQVLANNSDEKADILRQKAEEAKHKIEDAKKAIATNEFKLVLTLAKDSNSILKMLYGDVYEIVKTKDEVQGEVKGAEATASEAKKAKTDGQLQEEVKQIDQTKDNLGTADEQNGQLEQVKEELPGSGQSEVEQIDATSEEFNVGLK